MAFLDFLGKDIGGYAQGPTPSGAAGVPQTGINWGQLMATAMQRGSKPGSSAPMFAGPLTQQFGPQGQAQNPGIANAFQPLQDISQQQGKKDGGDMSSILRIIAGLYGFPIGGS